jgi:serine/threonine protein kinase
MNILMNIEEKEPGFLELKKLALADFGISTVMKNSTFSHTMKKVSGGVGNPGYIAPEVIKLNKYFHI